MNHAPVYVTCPTCRRRVLEVQWDYRDNFLLQHTLLDPVALDQQQILACVITDVRLWQLQRGGEGYRTSRRSRWWPRRPVPGHTLPEHQCQRTWDAFPIDLARPEDLLPVNAPF